MEIFNVLFEWLSENWLVVALVVSEVAALLPTKAKGIIHFLVKIGGAIFKQSSTSQKNWKK